MARVPGRDPSKPALVLHGHLDVVPADPAQLERRPVRRRDPRRHAVGPRRRRHEGHGRHDPHRARRHPRARASSPSATSSSRSSPTRRTAASTGSALARRQPPRAVRGRDRGDQRGRRLLDHRRRPARLPAADGREGAGLDPARRARPRGARLSRLIRDNAVTRLAEAVAALGRTEWPIRLTDTTRAAARRARRRSLGVDPSRSRPTSSPLATGAASGFLRATLRTTTNPTVLDGRLQAQRDPGPRRGAHRRPHAARRGGRGARRDPRARRRRRRDRDRAPRHRARGAASRAPSSTRWSRALGGTTPACRCSRTCSSGGTDNKALAELGITGYGFAPLRLPADLDFTGDVPRRRRARAARRTRLRAGAVLDRPASAL